MFTFTSKEEREELQRKRNKVKLEQRLITLAQEIEAKREEQRQVTKELEQLS